MAEGKRPESNRRAPASRPGGSGRSRSRTSPAAKREARPTEARTAVESAANSIVEPIRRAVAAAVEQQSEQRLGFTARRAAILAAVVCVLTLTIAGPVRTFFAQRAEQAQLAATEKALRSQIADLQQQKDKQTDPAYIAAQARARLGFVMPGDVPYQVQLPPSAVVPGATAGPALPAPSNDPWYTSLWHTIADAPHGPPPPPPTTPTTSPTLPLPPPPEPVPVPPGG